MMVRGCAEPSARPSAKAAPASNAPSAEARHLAIRERRDEQRAGEHADLAEALRERGA